MYETFPGIPIFPALGNHESAPVNRLVIKLLCIVLVCYDPKKLRKSHQITMRNCMFLEKIQKQTNTFSVFHHHL